MKLPVRSFVVIAVVVAATAIVTGSGHTRVAGPSHYDQVEGVYLASIGGGPDVGNFKYPRGIAVDRTGTVYVADTGYSRIQVFDSHGSFLFTWGTFGDAPGQFRRPSSLALDAALNVYVADAGSNRVQVFTRAGVFLRQWGSKGSGAGQFLRPGGIAVNAEGHVYVADTYNYRIQMFANDGKFLRSWGSKGTAPGQFHDPKALDGTGPGPDGIAVDRNAVVYVTDPWNHRVQVFTSDGRYLREWAHRANPCGQFNTPAAIALCKSGYLNAASGIAVDRNGSVFVVNQGLTSPLGGFHVQKFTANEDFVRMWGTDGFGPGQFEAPAGVAVDEDGNFYVADTGNNRVQKFSADGRFVKQWGSIGDGNLRQPAGIALDGAGNLYVADTANKRVQKFDGTGRFLGKWGVPIGTKHGSGEATFDSPSTIAVDRAGRIYVSDNGRPTQIFTSDGKFVGEWDGGGQHEIGGKFVIDHADNFLVERGRKVLRLSREGRHLQSWRTSPSDMSVDGHGNLYVTETVPDSRDSSRSGIRVFSAGGRQLARWSATRGPDGRPGQYYGIAVTGDGLVVALDVKYHRVEVFSTTGTLLGRWGSYGFAAGQFDNPIDVAVDATGRVYVSDYMNNRVQVFQLRRGVTPADR
jgi:tripartite motif-containing protein 71